MSGISEQRLILFSPQMNANKAQIESNKMNDLGISDQFVIPAKAGIQY
ncbi:MAG: hypothetical protein BMS9Abin26_0498 [Gammaproteobacteria bacterium]|nr:MAG: hypothetical protein BMS9Abin26_0498 [Gammaproteobacteria bacterium]